MKIAVRLFPPLKFNKGTQSELIDISDGSNAANLLEILGDESELNYYGKDALLILIDGKTVENSTILKEDQTVEVLLFIAGG